MNWLLETDDPPRGGALRGVNDTVCDDKALDRIPRVGLSGLVSALFAFAKCGKYRSVNIVHLFIIGSFEESRDAVSHFTSFLFFFQRNTLHIFRQENTTKHKKDTDETLQSTTDSPTVQKFQATHYE